MATTATLKVETSGPNGNLAPQDTALKSLRRCLPVDNTLIAEVTRADATKNVCVAKGTHKIPKLGA